MSSLVNPFRKLSSSAGKCFCLLLLMSGFIFNASLNHHVFVEAEAQVSQIDSVEYYPAPFDWDKKFEATLPQLQKAALILATQFNQIEVFSSDYSKVHPFVSLAIPPPHTTV